MGRTHGTIVPDLEQSGKRWMNRLGVRGGGEIQDLVALCKIQSGPTMGLEIHTPLLVKDDAFRL
jgi:hypothetical protein